MQENLDRVKETQDCINIEVKITWEVSGEDDEKPKKESIVPKKFPILTFTTLLSLAGMVLFYILDIPTGVVISGGIFFVAFCAGLDNFFTEMNEYEAYRLNHKKNKYDNYWFEED